MPNQNLEQKNEFAIICELVEAENEIGLKQLLLNGADIHGVEKDLSPVAFFAKQGNKKAVQFLLQKFSASLNDALLGAAWGGYCELIQTLLIEDKELTNIPQYLSYIMRGLYRNKDENKINEFFGLSWINPLRQAIYNYYNACWEKDEFIQKEEDANYLVNTGGLSYTEAYAWLEKHASVSSHEKRVNSMISLVRVINTHQLNFNQAQAWLEPQFHTWFLIGINKIRDQTFSLEIFLAISSYVVNLSDQDTHLFFQKHLTTVPKQLTKIRMDVAERRIFQSTQYKYLPTFFNKLLNCINKKAKKRLLDAEKVTAEQTLQRRLHF